MRHLTVEAAPVYEPRFLSYPSQKDADMKRALVASLASLGLLACSSSSSTTSTSGSTGRNGATATGSTSSHLTTSGATTTGSSTTTAGATTTGSSTTAGATTTGSTTAGSTTAAASTSSTGTTAGSTTAGSTSTAGSTGGTSTSTSTTASSSSSSGSTGTTTGTTGAAPDVATARLAPAGTPAAVTGVMTILASSYGPPKSTGTTYAGKYYVMDGTTNQVIYVYKPKSAGVLSFDPDRLDMVDVYGTISTYPADGGQVQISEPNLDIVDGGGPGTPPFGGQTATALQLSDASPDTSLVGYYVAVPAPVTSYTQENNPPELTLTTSTKTYVNGVALTDSTGDRILVDTFTFAHSSNNCLPTDGGNAPDLTGGAFNAVLDQAVTGDGKLHKVLFYGHCGQ